MTLCRFVACSLLVTACRFELPDVEAVELAVFSGNDQTGIVGHELAKPIVLRAEDAYDNPISDVTLYFTALGSATVSIDSVVTGDDGLGETRLTLSPTAGTNMLLVTTIPTSLTAHVIATGVAE